MQAVGFVGVGRPPRIEESPTPSPGPGQILVRIGGAGVCHSTPPNESGRSPAPRGAALVLDCVGVQPTIDAETTEFPLGQAVDVYRQLKAGRIAGRAVLVPAARSSVHARLRWAAGLEPRARRASHQGVRFEASGGPGTP